MRFLWWLVVTILALGVAALLAVVFWFPPSDPDSLALARERTARLSAFRLKKPLPGASVSTAALEQRLVEGGFKLGAPVLVRIYKLSFELELWMQRGNGYALFATYPICYFSGQLGPKIKHGDWQSPEGIYQVDARLLNPHSAHHRALNLGFPNTYDKQLGRAGVLLEVHGGCSSVGCYAITNPAIDDVYRLAEAALKGGQQRFQVQALPFRMTEAAMAAHSTHPQSAFWSELKTVADAFEQTRIPPEVDACNGHYRLARRSGGGAAPTSESSCRRL